MKRIGFIGLGIMGTAMARNIAGRGFPLIVYNRTASALESFASQPVKVARNPGELAAQSDVVITMLTGIEALNNVLWGHGGAAAAFDSSRTFINMSSISPAATLTIQDKLSSTGVNFIDAPVSGSKKPAEDGALIILAGGDRAVIESLNDVFLAMGKKVIYCGNAGQGSMMKMCINLLLGLMMEGLAEVLNLGETGGLDRDAILEVIQSGPMSAALFQMKSDSLKNDDYPPAFPLKHMTKDLKFVVDTAYQAGAMVPSAHMLLSTYSAAVSQGWGDMDFAAVMKVLQLLSAKSA